MIAWIRLKEDKIVKNPLLLQNLFCLVVIFTSTAFSSFVGDSNMVLVIKFALLISAGLINCFFSRRPMAFAHVNLNHCLLRSSC